MQNEFVTVAEAQRLTGKSLRTIRRFLKSEVEEYPEHFEMEKKNGREVWLIDAAFLERRYPFIAGDSRMSGDNGNDASRDNRGLRDKWQQEKQKQGAIENDGTESAQQSDTGTGDSSDDKTGGMPGSAHEENQKLWQMVERLQLQVDKKDEQLNQYYKQQGELMQTMGRLMEQDNLLLARSQEASIKVPGQDRGVVTEPIDIKPTVQKKKAIQTKNKNNTAKNRAITNNTKDDEPARVVESKTAKKKSWWQFRH